AGTSPGQSGKESQQRLREDVRRLFGYVMAALNTMSAEIGSPGPPYLQDIAIELFEIITQRPQDHRRALYSAAGGTIRLVVLPINSKPLPVILDHPVHGIRIAVGETEIGMVFRPHPLRRPQIPSVRVGEN